MMYFIFDIETIPDFDFVQTVLNDQDFNNDQLLEIDQNKAHFTKTVKKLNDSTASK